MQVDDALRDVLNDMQQGSSVPSQSNVGQGEERQLDLLFIIDATGSMGSYIASATKNVELIMQNIVESGRLKAQDAFRVGLVAYRDHPPQDNSYVSVSYAFTSDPSIVKDNLRKLYASGGGDGPEAVTAAMRMAMCMDWRPNASKMAVLIADAPAHALGEYGDGFASGSPDGEDPLRIAREMASNGITLFVVACEPALSGYLYGIDFFRALTVITSGVLVPLTTADLLSHVIVGSALEQMDMERLIQEVGLAVAQRVHGASESIDDVARELHEKLLLRNETTKSLHIESIHRETEESRHNVNVFVNSEDLSVARPQLRKFVGSRFTEKYLESRYNSSRSYGRPYYASAAAPSRPVPPPPGTGIGLSPPSSPGRKVVSEFKPFAATKGLSFADTPLSANAETAQQDSLTQSVELRFQSISLEQAKRITVAASWRTLPPRV